MMDPLTQQLVQRAMGGGTQSYGNPMDTGAGQPAPAPLPVVPPNPTTKVPQSAKRFENAQQIQDAYRNGWSPNPILLRAQLGHK